MLPDIDSKENLPDDWVWHYPLIAILAGLIVITLCLAVAVVIIKW